jgi:hypothetical protein
MRIINTMAMIAACSAAMSAQAQTINKYYARTMVKGAGGSGNATTEAPDKPEYVANPDFSVKSGWTLLGSASYGTRLVSLTTAGSGVSQNVTELKPGVTYKLTFHMHCSAGATHVVDYAYSIGTKTGSGSGTSITPTITFVATSATMPLVLKVSTGGHAYVLKSANVSRA